MIDLRQRLSECQIAIMLLTRLPAGHIQGNAPSLHDALWAYPFIGLPIGGLIWLVHFTALSLGVPDMLCAWIALSTLALLTGGLHFDGLADFADGVGGGRNKDHCLEIMRDSRIGSYGVLALVVAAGLWTTSIDALTNYLTLLNWVSIAVASRTFMTALSCFMPSARKDGLGHMASNTKPHILLPGLGLLSVLTVLNGFWFALPLVCMGVGAFSVAKLSSKRLGGQTGDVLGASQLLTEVIGWTVLVCLIQ